MINLQTLLSAFDEKGTLLKWLKKVEAALTNSTLETVQVVVVDETHIKMKFVFADGTSVESPSITLPRGPQGPEGPQGPQGPQGEGGTVTIDSLIASLEGDNYISVGLNGQQSKVKIELDSTMLDNEPTEGSNNLVKSGGVYGAIHGLTANTLNCYVLQYQNVKHIGLSGELNSEKNINVCVYSKYNFTNYLSFERHINDSNSVIMFTTSNDENICESGVYFNTVENDRSSLPFIPFIAIIKTGNINIPCQYNETFHEISGGMMADSFFKSIKDANNNSIVPDFMKL